MHPIRLLHLEDSLRDAELIRDTLEENNIVAEVTHVTNRAAFEKEVNSGREFDIVLCDHNLTGYDGFAALDLAQRKLPLTPFLIISGSIGEEEAVKGLQKGATDYLLKGRLERLPEAVLRALREARNRRERMEFEQNLRINEERMRLALAATNDAIWDWNREDDTFDVNEVFKNLFGEPTEWWNENWWIDRTHPDDRTRVRVGWEAALEGGKTIWSERYRLRKKDGAWAHIHNRACISRDENGELKRVVGAINDRTERVEEEARHKALEQQLVQAQKLEAIGTLAGGIAHDFNNILGIIVANAEIAHAELKMPGGDKTAVDECLDETLTASRRGRDLVRQILTFSRKEQAGLHAIKPVEVIQECARMLRSTLPAMVQLDVQLPKTCPLILGDETQLQQVLMNLCTNAWHALRDNEGQIVIAVDEVSFKSELVRESVTIPEGSYVRICVNDNGSGIPPEVRARIFEPFYTTKAPGVGTGLGLSVVHGIVKSCRGIITVDSTPGHGTEFCLLFPVTSSSEAAAVEDAQDEVPRGSGQRILLVDDDAAMARSTERVLQRNGYNVLTYNEPEKALETLLAGEEKFDLLITDYSMPGLSGTDLAQYVSDQQPDLPIILLSGMGDNAVRRQAEHITAIAEKPIWPDDLCRLVGSILLARQAKAADNQQRRILVIDDDPAHLSACARMLRQDNYSVFTASNGAEALNMLASVEVDVVLTDIIMPEKEGLEVIMALRTDYPDVQIIAMSGGGRISAEECLDLSKAFKADQTIYKPFSRDELLSRLQVLFEATPPARPLPQDF